jgi:hypothetical protein
MAEIKSGNNAIESLSQDELAVIQNFCFLGASAILTAGVQEKKPMIEIILNAMRNGIALGLRIKIKEGKIEKKG